MKGDRHRHVSRRINLINLGANLCGAVLIIIYFGLQADPLQSGKVTPGWYLPAFIAGFVAVFLLGGWLMGRILDPVDAWHKRATSGGEVESPPLSIRRRALAYPTIMAGISLSMFVLAGIYFTLLEVLSSAGQQVHWSDFAHLFLGLGGIAGMCTASIVLFAAERVWQPEISLFFPDGALSEVPAFRLTVRRRLLILFVMVTIPLLVLALISYSYAAKIAGSDQPEAFLPVLRNLELYLVGIGLLMAVSLALTLGASLVRPLETFSRKMDAVRAGDVEERMDVTSNDELGALAEGFNAMVDGLQREDVIRRLFGHYVSPQVAEHAIEHGADLAGGEYCEATVMFTDIRDFTALTEQMKPEALIALLNRYFSTISAVVVEHGGLVTRLGGDSLLAVFGTPLNPAQDHPHRAVQAAWGLIPALAAFNQAQIRHKEPTLRIGVGVATGPVLAGNVGSKERLEYTVLGDAVNLASRLEAMTKEVDARILLSAETAQAVESWAPLQPIGQVTVRGKQQPVQVYALHQA
ncbi:MAG: adenylate/guanylate cyclase domain-containing protein [Anaerolineae bacterium]|nr:adenylate/guanylate cyclase domain-containing protein [Anaerolineae bacterium]